MSVSSIASGIRRLNSAGVTTTRLTSVLTMAAVRTFSTSTIRASHAFRGMRHVIGAHRIIVNRATTQTFHSSPTTNGEADFKCAAVFKTMKETLEKEGANLVKKVNGVYGFNVKNGPNGEEGTWIVDVKNGNGTVEFGGKTTPDVTLTMSDADLLDMMTGKLEAQKAFFKGQLKIKGNMGLAMKLKEFQPKPAAK